MSKELLWTDMSMSGHSGCCCLTWTSTLHFLFLGELAHTIIGDGLILYLGHKTLGTETHHFTDRNSTYLAQNTATFAVSARIWQCCVMQSVLGANSSALGSALIKWRWPWFCDNNKKLLFICTVTSLWYLPQFPGLVSGEQTLILNNCICRRDGAIRWWN